MAFVPQDPKSVVGTKTENGRTIVTAFASHLKATESIRKGLGVAFSDYFSLGERTVFVEGQTDADLMRWFLAASDEEAGCDWPLLRSSSFSDRGGSSHLAGFLRANYSLIRAERVAVSLLDGDDAGVKAIKDLTGYFGGMSESFNSNAEYVLIRKGFAIEGLFPDSWIVDIHNEKPDWFKEFIVDGGGTLMSFAIKTSKDNVINKLKSRAEVEDFKSWSGEWRVTCDALEGALAAQEIKVHGPVVAT
jgi:putative ATP-dependent endonuclease of OLD family